MHEEVVVLYYRNQRDLMQLFQSKKPIRYKWVYRVKHNAYGGVSMYRARLAAKQHV